MKKAYVPLIALAALATAIPATASAQHYGGQRGPGYEAAHRGWAPMSSRVGVLHRKIDFAHRARAMSTGKAREFRRDIDNLLTREAQYRARGFGMNERRDLERRYATIERSIDRYVRNAERRGGRHHRR